MPNICAVRTLLQPGYGSYSGAMEYPLPHEKAGWITVNGHKTRAIICKHCGSLFVEEEDNG